MNLAGYAAVTTNNWVDMTLAADYAGVPVDVLVQAIMARDVRASTSHPDRPGDWMVPLADVDQWGQRRALARTLG